MTPAANDEGVFTAAIDATHLRQSEGGIARYIRGLVRGLRARGDVEVIELGGGPREKRGTLRKKLLTAGLDLVWYPWLGRSRAAALKADVYHCPAPRGPLFNGRLPVVMTVHDLVPFLFPETMTRWSRWYSLATHRRMAAVADRIVCNSADTARDVVEFLGVEEKRVRVIPLGVDSHFFEPVAAAEPPPAPYVLFVGTQERRKNLERLEQAVEDLRRRGFPHELVLAGADAWGDVRIGKSFVRQVGRVSDIQLRRLYADAACLALPSLHEGFGLPALEAMAVGTPVVAGRAGALPEVTGGAAIMVDPHDTVDIANGLERAISADNAQRDGGRRRAALFTWEKTATATFAVYRELA
ncbi:MAG TPA: glycosyltransferase family 1 protein [Gemmatimonadaceae bacterium]|nr:glycosyltransferase family 1 protein [Gemmatimonadaceae bacterium]